MNQRFWAYACIGIGIACLITWWGSITRVMTTATEAEGRVVSEWSTSGSPQEDLMHTRRFTWEVNREAKDDPDIKPLQANKYFASTASRDDVIFVSFLSGKPPDLVEFWPAQLADAVAAGQIQPVDELIEREDRIRQRMGLPPFIEGLRGGEQSIVRFSANPRDWRIVAWRRHGTYAEEAARLLNMHGKVIGFNPPGMAKALTYNGRLFEQAAKAGGKYKVLVDENGRAKPPKTWVELREYAKLITEWGIREYGEDNPDRPYGLIVQGMAEQFFMRAVDALAATAGNKGFDYRTGRYTFDSNGLVGAFKLLMLMRQDGSVRPGTEQRHYEVTRAELSMGKAAMLMDGWHAVMIGAQKNPAAKEYLGSAAIPVPYEVGDAAGKAAVTKMLGFEVGRGAYLRDGGGDARITCITTGSDHPDAAWDWQYRRQRFVEKIKTTMLEHFNLPTNRTEGYCVFESQEPEWVEFRKQLLPFQFQAYEYVETTQVWPFAPNYPKVAELTSYDVTFLEAFKAAGDCCPQGKFDDLMKQVRTDVGKFTTAVNERLAAMEEGGQSDPTAYTFDDWDATRAGEFYVRQATRYDPRLDEGVARLRTQLNPELKDFNEITLPPAWPLLLSIAGMVLATILVYILWQRLIGAARGAGGMQVLGTAAKRNWHAYVFVAPAVCALFVFVLYPAVYQVFLSLHNGTGQTALRWAGGTNYARAFDDAKFWGTVIPNTLMYMFIVATCAVTVGLLLGSLLNLALRGISVYRTMFFVPMVVSMSVVAVIFFGLLGGPGSTVNGIWESLGLYEDGRWLNDLGHAIGLLDDSNTRIDWLNDERFALFTLMGVAIWQGLPYNTILCLAGLQSIPKDLYEAAKVDGAGVLARFFRITIPQMAPILLIILFNSLVGAARHFGNVYILTKGNNGTEIVSTYVFKTGFEWNKTALPDIGYASTLSIIYAVLLAGFIIVNTIFVARRLKRKYSKPQEQVEGGAA